MIGQIELKQKKKNERIYWKDYYDENTMKTVGNLNESRRKVTYNMQNWIKMEYDEARAVLTYTTKL